MIMGQRVHTCKWRFFICELCCCAAVVGNEFSLIEQLPQLYRHTGQVVQWGEQQSGFFWEN